GPCVRLADGRCGSEWRECPPGPGSLYLMTAPDDARVSLDGKVVCTASPCSLREVAPGKHTVVVENVKKGSKATRTVVIQAGLPTRTYVDADQKLAPALDADAAAARF